MCPNFFELIIPFILLYLCNFISVSSISSKIKFPEDTNLDISYYIICFCFCRLNIFQILEMKIVENTRVILPIIFSLTNIIFILI